MKPQQPHKATHPVPIGYQPDPRTALDDYRVKYAFGVWLRRNLCLMLRVGLPRAKSLSGLSKSFLVPEFGLPCHSAVDFVRYAIASLHGLLIFEDCGL